VSRDGTEGHLVYLVLWTYCKANLDEAWTGVENAGMWKCTVSAGLHHVTSQLLLGRNADALTLLLTYAKLMLSP